MGHIHTEPHQYDFTVSAYIIRTDGPEPVIIMHRHKILHTYLQFGGHIELHENPWSAMTHEIQEESGYAMSQLKLLQPALPTLRLSSGILHPTPVATLSIQFGDTDHYHTDLAYAFVTNEPPAGVLGEDESDDITTFTAAQLAALPADDIPGNVRDIALYIFTECLGQWTEADCSAFRTDNPTAG